MVVFIALSVMVWESEVKLVEPLIINTFTFEAIVELKVVMSSTTICELFTLVEFQSERSPLHFQFFQKFGIKNPKSTKKKERIANHLRRYL